MLNWIEAGRRVRRQTVTDERQPTPSPMDAPPAPASSARLQCLGIVDTRKIEFSQTGAYVEYGMNMRHGEHTWVFWRRYREYARFRARLLAHAPSVPSVATPLPPKHMARHLRSDVAVRLRSAKLAEWLARVLDEAGDALVYSADTLAFVGLGSLLPEGSQLPPIHVSMLHSVAESGDVVLFRTKATVPAIQRVITNSAWDHVGILVFTDRLSAVCAAADAHQCGFIECDINGCRYYPVKSYEVQHWHLQYADIAVRQLQWDGRGAPETIMKLREWCHSVLGKPYQLTLSKILNGRSIGPENVDQGFFCSELLAHAWKAIDILPAEHPSSGYWPVDFGASASRKLPLRHKATLGDEISIDFRTPAVANLCHVPTRPPRLNRAALGGSGEWGSSDENSDCSDMSSGGAPSDQC
ncbi:hypothetical protein AB1Y20_020170 [Prymnesium parvum]|uniref:PX domain-containing protein n=1 Tax=Prymnesium parvum TaxID=97485 RepID=A0AB34JYH3_PRYPA